MKMAAEKVASLFNFDGEDETNVDEVHLEFLTASPNVKKARTVVGKADGATLKPDALSDNPRTFGDEVKY